MTAIGSPLVWTAAIAVMAGVFAQWFRVFFDGLRRREQIRKVLLLEIIAAQEYLGRVSASSDSWNMPRSDHTFWLQMDGAIRGFDQVYVDLVLFPVGQRYPVTTWFLNFRSVRYQAAALGEWYAEDYAAGRIKDQTYSGWERRYDRLSAIVHVEQTQGDQAYNLLVAGTPKPGIVRWVLGADPPSKRQRELREVVEAPPKPTEPPPPPEDR